MTGGSQNTRQVSRRNFLRASAGLTIGLGLSPLDQLAGYAKRVLARDDLPWDELGAKLNGQLLRPDDMGYLGYASPWNLRYANILPGGVSRCLEASDVQASLHWAKENGVPLVIRSVGHSYAGFSTTLGLIIDVSPMNQVEFDSRTGRATLGGGARNTDVYANLRAPGSHHGRCKAVGVAGLVLGGGIGFNMRAHGLLCDQFVGDIPCSGKGRNLIRARERRIPRCVRDYERNLPDRLERNPRGMIFGRRGFCGRPAPVPSRGRAR
ncbi:MAG: FAD-binding oxidoreductase [Chloroflexi bacterium]|nr:FAD-binding oxidoreductase [Chloroflexota bacterium]